MPPHLDLSPQISLRRAGSYNPGEKAPLSSTSSRFSFNHLIVSPPPSPGLPALVPRHGKPTPTHSPRKCFRAALWVSGVLVILYFGFVAIRKDQATPKVGWALNSGEEYEMVGEAQLPDFPTPVMVTDKRGRAKWTMSIPPNQPFPLQPKQYAELCSQSTEVADHVIDLHRHTHVDHGHYGYYHVDKNFMDVADAEAHGLLPGPKAKGKTSMVNGLDGHIIGVVENSLIEMDVCKTSLTFVLETSDAGMGKTLMMLWMAYGLAEKEGRAFFLDDSRWAYGSYTNFFHPPPLPNCRPPPRHEMIPCPHHARHLVVSAATVYYTFGGAFSEEFEDPKKMEVFRQRPIFDMARKGAEALFRLVGSDADYVKNRVEELRTKSMSDSEEIQDGTIIGIHVRHGDRHPYSFEYRDSYIPLDQYSNKASALLHKVFNSSEANGEENGMAERSFFVVASDDPDVYESDEFSHAYRAQEQIKLASKSTLDIANKPKQNVGIRKFEDEAVGWEGGFFAPMFWSLGKPTVLPATAVEPSDTSLQPTSEALRLREFVGRAYLMDLAVIGATSDYLVCTISSMGCRLLAIMMGWEDAIEKKRHINIDGDFEWRGVSWRR
ncbi:hypothetical protein BP5796_10611 [Coleophoma crateriformis]|uniref:Uncharacterized protein n=1 Tax=Coleophoma crateriformis TaxID=565419 RepID=A0A3D8QQM3_9HELO|nr:hypothetical protein BP5796_10611 [Coleophoma crateriformis]